MNQHISLTHQSPSASMQTSGIKPLPVQGWGKRHRLSSPLTFIGFGGRRGVYVAFEQFSNWIRAGQVFLPPPCLGLKAKLHKGMHRPNLLL